MHNTPKIVGVIATRDPQSLLPDMNQASYLAASSLHVPFPFSLLGSINLTAPSPMTD
ncbi:hypothetical protein GJ744_002488 [Endocarpon pusillum]|uniref:Uncharacterized protein n=1 Tax=Endocarpon pusillum TaxID=364733 RepID=A0A8H7AA92_9EURO|nr:hypothetical protein GJ744_002488 [Endocarpon pusillum]